MAYEQRMPVIRGVDVTTELLYEIRFSPLDLKEPGYNIAKKPCIEIATPPIRKFSEIISLQDAEKGLIKIALKIRAKTGGQIYIDENYGAVLNGPTPLAKDVPVATADKPMVMRIYLGQTLQKLKSPVVDAITGRWNKELVEYNPPEEVKEPTMTFSCKSMNGSIHEDVNALMAYLEKNTILSSVKIC